jgi:peroxiredoxin
MAVMHTPQKNDGFIAPDFTLKNVDGAMLSLHDVQGKNGTVVAFICNHCPYVKAIITRLIVTAKQLQGQGIGFVAIMPNDTLAYPEDSFENMQKFAVQNGFSFPYLIDETQNVAKSYDAICTPDLFGFNANNQMIYRGRLDSAGANPADGNTIPELFNAMTKDASVIQHSSMGCSIKWRS